MSEELVSTKGIRKSLFLILVFIIFGLILVIFIFSYTGRADWTGFRGKTLYDWMELLLVPALIALGVFSLNYSDSQRERHIATENNQISALKKYIGDISEVRIIARAITLIVLQELNGFRKGVVMRFLVESRLIEKDNSIIDLQRADFRGANLFRKNLRNVNLNGIVLKDADLRQCDLSGSLLENSKLSRSSFSGAILTNTSFSGSKLKSVDFTGANLTNANIRQTDLRGTIFASANLTGLISDENNISQGPLPRNF